MAVIKQLNWTFIFSCKLYYVFLKNVVSSKELRVRHILNFFSLHHLDLQVKICQLFSICLVNDKILHVNLSEQNVFFLKLIRSPRVFLPFF